ncbi:MULTISPECIES: ATP-binding cassette domain-containing protein [Streptomyces]|uniref:ATP-binding cassette domain-containing protein n=1 Tax=Streptomyces TaxID=1883 RepID=UPI0007C4BC13|nr:MULTISPECIES: ATP-binding cassette domain-containing protein [Streptomyces]
MPCSDPLPHPTDATATVPGSPGRPAPAAEIDYTGRRHRHALQEATWRDLARRIPTALAGAARLAWAADRRMVMTIAGCQLLSGLAAAVLLTTISRAMKTLLSASDAHRGLAAAWPHLVTAAGAVLVSASAAIFAEWATRRLNPQIAAAADLRLLHLHQQAELSAYEAPGFSERSQAADLGTQRTAEVTCDAKAVTHGLVQVAAAGCALALLQPLLLAGLVLAVLPRCAGGLLTARLDYQVHDRCIATRARRNMMRPWLTKPVRAAETRANQMTGFLLFWYRTMCDRSTATELAASRPYLRTSLVAAALSGSFTLCMWAALALLVLAGHLDVAGAGAAVIAGQAAARALTTTIRHATELFHHALYQADVHAFSAELHESAARRGSATVTAPHRIHLDGAAFAYRDRAAPALHPLTLTLTRGEMVAVVGENGAGKSTLVRLLTGLTLPTTGSVCWDGTDLATADAQSVWRHVALVPQDIGHWPLTVRENITFGLPLEDRCVWDAAQRVGLDTAIRGLPAQLDTLLAGKLWGGEDLSGGQWQRLACARMLVRDPGLRILDEPASALDARGELHLLRTLRQTAAERITLVVTHRLAHLRLFDRALVLDQGRVVEDGPVEALLADPGSRLRALFDLATGCGTEPPLADAPPAAGSAHLVPVAEHRRSAAPTVQGRCHPARQESHV